MVIGKENWETRELEDINGNKLENPVLWLIFLVTDRYLVKENGIMSNTMSSTMFSSE